MVAPLLGSLAVAFGIVAAVGYVAHARGVISSPAALLGSAHVEKSCTMNGFGQGTCSFTNTGTATGSMCGRIDVEKSDVWSTGTAAGRVGESSTICSGDVAPKSTQQVTFMVSEVNAACSPPSKDLLAGKRWSDYCDFAFVPDPAKLP